MRFNIDSDEGNVLRLWLTLDNPSDVPSLAVWAGGERVAELGANTFRPDVRDHGLHATGEAGFTLDESSLPGITGMQDLEHLVAVLLRLRRDADHGEGRARFEHVNGCFLGLS